LEVELSEKKMDVVFEVKSNVPLNKTLTICLTQEKSMEVKYAIGRTQTMKAKGMGLHY